MLKDLVKNVFKGIHSRRATNSCYN